MTQEDKDFQHFRDKQLVSVDFDTGTIDSKQVNRNKYYYNIGSTNQDGYVRVYCNGSLRMKHRLLFWLYHNYLPEEVDHIDGVRNNNAITNLQASNRSHNTKDKTPRSYKHLSTEQVHEICSLIVSGYTITYIANKFGKSRTQIKAIKSKKYWSEISDNYF